MLPVYLKKGDTAYFYPADENGIMRSGTVVHVFQLEGYVEPEHYVIEIPTHIDPVLEVRDPYTVSDDPDKPIGTFRMTAEARAALTAIREKVKALQDEERKVRWRDNPLNRKPSSPSEEAK